MAGRSLFYGSDGNAFNDVCVQGPRDSIFMSTASSPFLGPSSMVSFQDAKGKKRSDKSFFQLYDQEENGDEELDEYFRQPDKKRRLTVEQLQFLEKSFVVENKLEPERKSELAKELGLQPRQVAIWFQNRRARWKTKQLEKDYEALLASYDSLKADYDNLLKEKDNLKDEIASITELLHNEKGSGNLKSLYDDNVIEAPSKQQCADSVSEDEGFKVSAFGFQQEEPSSVKSDVFDSDSPRYIEGVRPSLLDPGDSSYVFEPDQSDISQDEEDNISKNLLRPQYFFTRMEEDNISYSGPPSSNYLGFPVEDHAFDFW